MENCCESLVKHFMVLCNIIFALAGTFLIGFGSYAQIAAKDYLNFLGDDHENYVIITLGILKVCNFINFNVLFLLVVSSLELLSLAAVAPGRRESGYSTSTAPSSSLSSLHRFVLTF